ncbi:MAG: short-chain dehydrogenase [Rhodospirillaceae bacterium TMED167]|nr:short-chain dehydrogenase [Rhodospirillaceae bacterium]OUW30957.1 MAG: short-chain dehydrogenase [Rhodospirillaceae bacterium TMED167]
MSNNLKAIITGGGSGIGEATSRSMLEAGYEVISVGLREPDWTHERFTSLTCDLLDENATAYLAAQLAEDHTVTHFVHNAGMIRHKALEDVTVADLQDLTQLHAAAALIFTQALVPGMKERNFGRIIFNSSRALLGLQSRTAYSYSKAGLVGMARTWALELAPHGVTVNVLAPGPILTDNFWDLVEKDSPQQHAYAAKVPVGRLGEPEDVANAILFFADPKSGFVTGQTLFVCGGVSIFSG